LVTACASGPSGSGYGYALASAPISSPNLVEVRTSTDGVNWSAASSPFASSTIAPGIGAVPDRYLLAWFGPSNSTSKTLHTAVSTNGSTWEFHATHGNFQVDINARPSVEYNFGTKSWLVAFRNVQGEIVVIPVDAPGGRAVTISGATTGFPPSLVWLIDRLVLLYREGNGRIVSLTSVDGLSWPAGPGTPITSNGQEVITEGGFYANRTLVALWLAVQSNSSTGTLTTGNIRVYSYNSGNWELRTILNRTDPLSRGPAITGIDGGLVVAETGIANGTVMWFNGTRGAPLATRTQYEVSLGYGPRSNNSRTIPDLMCSPCNRCVDVLGGIAPDYLRDCTDRSGSGQTFRCKICDPCIGATQFCRPPQLGGDAPGYSETTTQEPCRRCPPP
jgi:hypothetical protein